MDAQVGFSLPESVGLHVEEGVDVAARTDCDFFELVLDGSGHPNRLPEDLANRLADAGLDLVTHLPFAVDVAAPFESQHEGLLDTHRNCLDAAADLGASKAVLHPSSAAWRFAWSTEEVEDAVVDSVGTLHAYAADRGVELTVENLITSRFTAENFERLLDRVDADMTFDTGHARAVGFESAEVAAFVAANRDRISHVHLNDTLGESDDHLPVGAGIVDFPAVFDALGDDWTGTLCVEAVVGDVGYVEESVARVREMFEGN
ncbi:Sugar phosphate isomerase/epimerase [Halogranum amylolyticum]|uniref:Sugar phosphate isomerase/epimerase n=1 Tax=Halogranum amylolyticum TaxID=660520 RepID=A0A1H8R0Y5_9EURY|nr:sugar phosphate isomerase/epimerase family protein [Halogranum amylolyticum]SEO60016.1 Sugar phosphate isomerase/epimerase [Halogranum amylolyticum]